MRYFAITRDMHSGWDRKK